MVIFKDNQLRKSFQILNSNLLLVLAVYMLDVLYGRLVYRNLGYMALTIVIPAKIYVLSGIFGVLFEFTSREELVLKFNRFKKNTKNLWPIILFLYAIPGSIYFFIIRGYLRVETVSVFTVYAYSYVLIDYFLVLYLLQKKYIRPLSLKRYKIRFSFQNVITLGFLLIFQLFVFYLLYYLRVGEMEVSRFTFFALNYVNFLIFLYISRIFVDAYPEIREKFTNKREIYMVNPMGGGVIPYIASLFLRQYPPIFVVIKALTPKGYRFREFNRLPFKRYYYEGNKLVVVTCFSFNCDDAYRIASEFKKKGSKVIMGGPHVTYMSDEALEYCDSVVMGEAESVWQEVMEDYESDSLKPVYKGSPESDCYHLVHQELLNSPPEIIKDFLETSRGCKFKCKFCAVPSLSEGKMRTARIGEVVELLKKIKHKYKRVLFIDNNIYSDPGYAKELFQALKPIGIKWRTQCSIDIGKNKEMLKLAKEAGCESLLIGFEIVGGSDEKNEGGKLAMADKFLEYASNIKNAGIKIKAHFIFGFESDTISHLWRMWAFCFRLFPTATVLSFLTPFPGTSLYYEMIDKDCITNLNWQNYNAQKLVFQHSRIKNKIFYKITSVFTAFFLFTTSFLGVLLLLILVISFSEVFGYWH